MIEPSRPTPTVRAAFAAALMLALSACAPETGTTPTGAATGEGLVAKARPVSPARAKQLFDTICAASLPHFATAPQRLAANGFTRTSPLGTGTLYSQTENASFQIQDGPGFGKTCSMVVGTTAPRSALRQAIMVGQIVESPMGPATLYPGTRALILEGRASPDGGVTIANYRLLSDREVMP